MGYTIMAILLLAVFSILSWVLTGNAKQEAKDIRNEIAKGPLGKMALTAAIIFVIVVTFFACMIIDHDTKVDQRNTYSLKKK